MQLVIAALFYAVLDKLAEEHELSRTKVLEMLILSEEQHELYLPKQPSR